MTKGDIGVVVNYFTNYTHDASRVAMVSLSACSLRLLLLSPVVGTILVVDGSKVPDKDMSGICDELGVGYFHAGHEISYVDAYNYGWKMLREPYVLLMANDIMPFPITSIEKLRDVLQDQSVGCVFPYLASSRSMGDEVQQIGFYGRGKLSCEPSSMSLNLNIFRRDVLEQIEGLDPKYTASFAEPIILIRIRSLGYRVVLVGEAIVHHLDAMTKSLGQSNIGPALYVNDRNRWFAEYPAYASPRGLAAINLSVYPFTSRLGGKIYWKLVMRLPSFLRRRFISFGLWLEPYFCRYP
jgi:GT2 family glycosyltransferase